MVQTIEDYLNFVNNHYPNRIVFRWNNYDTDELIEKTFAEYTADIRRAARYVQMLCPDVRGTHFAILAQNSYDYAVNLFGIMLSGAVAVLLNPEETEENICYTAQLADTDIVLSDGSAEEKYPSLANSLTAKSYSLLGYRACDPLINLSSSEPYEEMALILFTSGTTGKSKGVMISRKNMFAQMDTFLNIARVAMEKYYASMNIKNFSMDMMPVSNALFVHRMFHAAGISALLAHGMFGITSNLCLNLRYIYQDLERMPCDRIAAVPIILELFYKDLVRGKKGKLGNLREISVGAAKIDAQIMNVFHENGFAISQGYAMTESFCGGTMNPYTDITKIASVGKAGEGMQIRIEDGEVCLKGDSIMIGYYNNPEETAKVLRDGWLYTGDLGYLDEDGYLYLTGRKKNLIILSGGENVSPEELEGLISANDSIKEIVVYEKNDKICAEIFCDAEHQEDIRNYVTEVNRTLPSYKRVATVAFRSEPFPRTTSGKIKRR